MLQSHAIENEGDPHRRLEAGVSQESLPLAGSIAHGVHINQASDARSSDRAAEPQPKVWTRVRIVGAAIVGAATIVGTVIAVIRPLP